MSTAAPTPNPRAYGVVLSSASTANGDPIAAYAPTFGAILEAAGRIHRAQPGTIVEIVRLRGPEHPRHPGEYTDSKGRTPAQIARDWQAWATEATKAADA